MELIILFIAISFVASSVGSISGIGGGVLIKPVLDALSGLGVDAVSFLSGCTVLAMSIVSLLRSRKNPQKVEPRRGTLLAIGGALGGLVGKMLFDVLLKQFSDGRLIGGIQSGVLCLISIIVLFYVWKKDRISTLNLNGWFSCLFIGMALGILSSFLGIGGGPINLMVLSFFFSMESKVAAIHSLYIIFFSQAVSLVFTVTGGNVPAVSPVYLLVMILGGVLGALFGSHIYRKMSNKHVDILFTVLVVLVILITAKNLVGAVVG